MNGMIRMNNKLILNDENEKNIINNKNDVVKNSKKVLNSKPIPIGTVVLEKIAAICFVTLKPKFKFTLPIKLQEFRQQ